MALNFITSDLKRSDNKLKKKKTFMLSSQAGVNAPPLSPSAQAAIKKHLPKLYSQHLNKEQLRFQRNICTADVGCLTDLSSKEHLSEIEIFSLLEEQIPKYKIRSNLLTNFTGYPNRDEWCVHTPALSIPLGGLGLTKDQTRETLNYFLLCGNRISQMTRAYDDIEAVIRLLEEKEKDLELTVQIGKELLTQNNILEIKITKLEADLKACYDDRSQLLHDLHKKTELIGILTTDAYHGCETDFPTSSNSVTFDILQRKISLLQDENVSLKVEALHLVSKTDEIEAHERKLMTDITTQLNETNILNKNLKLELEQQREENRLQHEQIIGLSSKLTECENRLNRIIRDNDENITLLNLTRESQNCLALELIEFKLRYQEVLSLLQETQEQLRNHRKKISPQINSLIWTSGFSNPESLHSELMESSQYSENSIDSGIYGEIFTTIDPTARPVFSIKRCNRSENPNFVSGSVSKSIHKQVFDTIRCVKRSETTKNESIKTSQIESSFFSSTCIPIVCSMPYLSSQSGKMKHFRRNNESTSFRNSSSDDEYPSQPSGVPGAPGARDLEIALTRLTSADVLSRRAIFSYTSKGTYNRNPKKVIEITSDCVISVGPLVLSSCASVCSSVNQWRNHADKIKIVKPIEGSQTLNHWSKLATPTLSGLLEERPGVTIRGGRGLDELGMQCYTLSDIEEDVSEGLPGKKFEPLNCIYTYTTTMAQHPNDGLINEFSLKSPISPGVESASTSGEPSYPSTPKAGLSRKNSYSSFTVNFGLCPVLNKQGINAVMPSTLNTPAKSKIFLTTTPCNSPEQSPKRSLPAKTYSEFCSDGKEITATMDKVTEMKKMNLYNLKNRALRSRKVVEKLESSGFENIFIQPNEMSNLYSTFKRNYSPMAQLTSLKEVNSNNRMFSKLYCDNDPIKYVPNNALLYSVQSNCNSRGNITLDKYDKNRTGYQNNSYEISNATDYYAPQSATEISQPIIALSKQILNKNFRHDSTSHRQSMGITKPVRKDLGKVSDVKGRSSESISPCQTCKEITNSEEDQTVSQTVGALLFGRKGGWL